MSNRLVRRVNKRPVFGKIWSNERTLTKLLGLLLATTSILLVTFFIIYYYNHYFFPGGNDSLDQNLLSLKQHILATPDDPSARIQLAALYFDRGDYDQVIEHGDTVLAANPENQDALYLVGLAYIQTGNPLKGIPLLAQFAEVRQASAMWRTDMYLEEVLYFLGGAYLQTNQLDLAKSTLNLALEIDHTDADALYLLGETFAKLGQTELAAEKYLVALDFVPDFEAVYQALYDLDSTHSQPGRQAYAEAGLAFCHRDYSFALAKLDLALEASPRFTSAYVLLGLVYEGQGEPDMARQALEMALSLDPENFLAHHVLGRLAARNGEVTGSGQ